MTTTTTTAGELNHTNIGQQITVNLFTYAEDAGHEPTGEKYTGTLHAIEHTAHGTTITVAAWYNMRSRRYTVVHNPHTAFVWLLEPQQD